MLRLRAGTATLLIGPRAAAGVHGGRYCLDSETDIRQRLTLSLQDQASREAIRRFWAPWQSDARLAGVTDQSIVDRIAYMSVHGPLIVFLVVDTSVHRRDSSVARAKQAAEALQNQNQFKPWTGPVKPPAPIAVSAVTPAPAHAPTPVDRSVIAPPTKAIGDWTIAEKLAAILPRTADSRKLSQDTQQQLKGMLSDPKFVAWLVGSLLVWFVSQFFVVGEIFDMLLAGAALILSGAGIFFALQSLVGAAHLIGAFVEATRSAKDDKDLDAAADILAEIIVMIGITVLIAALTHATSRATSEGMKASTIKKPPPERTAPVERVTEKAPEKTVADKGAAEKAAAEKAAADKAAAEKAAAEKAAAEKAAAEKAEASKRVAQLAAEGHGPQRHEGQLTEQQLADRVQKKFDPETGTRSDKYNKKSDGTPANHKCGDHATKFNSEEAYVRAESSARTTQTFKDAAARGDPNIKVEQPLEQVFGPDYRSQLTGKTRTTPWPDTTTPPVNTDFTDGSAVAIYSRNGAGGYDLKTMYPQPK